VKTKVIVLSKRKLMFGLLLLVLIVLFMFSVQMISIHTMNYYDPIYKGAADAKEVAFACNVVWGNEYLTDILRILKENDIKITFFIGGYWAKEYPEELMKIAKEGHDLGNHGYAHKKQTQLNIEQNKAEILKAEEAIKNVTGVKTSLFAPPYGDVNEKVTTTAEGLGYKVIMWSIDTIDWNTKDYTQIVARVGKKQHNGAIVLMHPTQVTVKALPQVIKNLKSNGYKIGTVRDVLN
jgi:probable sporulation protein (polysaccharide deacetylase family)